MIQFIFSVIFLFYFNVSNASDLNSGDYVYANNQGVHLVGRVNAVYNETVEVTWIQQNGLPFRFAKPFYYWRRAALAKSVGCVGDFCIKDIVYGNNGHHLVGEVKNLFENQLAEIQWLRINGQPINDSKKFYWRLNQLQRHISTPITPIPSIPQPDRFTPIVNPLPPIYQMPQDPGVYPEPLGPNLHP